MKDRIDKILVDLGFFDSREKAKKHILAGKIIVNNHIVDKAGYIISSDDKIEIKEDVIPYVSRGGLKLKKAIDNFGISLDKKICMDIGASTGGFTDVMLKHNASKVFSVDVGYGQLDWKLRNDDRVINLERTNIRYLENDLVPEKIDFFSIDVSFISLKLVFPKLKEFSADKIECVALIKPQFEVGRNEVGKNGVVRGEKSHKKAIELAIAYAKENEFSILNLDFSPIRGPKGNVEFLMYITNEVVKDYFDIDRVIKEAYASFD